MTHIELDKGLLCTLQGKVVVLTGGATGIGRSAVQQFVSYGASVTFGDIQDQAGTELASSLGIGAAFVHCDISSYMDLLNLFAQAEKRFGRVDIVVANAGVVDRENIFGIGSDWTQEPRMREIDVNLKGAIYTSRIGTAYLRKYGGGDLVLTSSIAGFKESAGLPIYTAGKHGIVGLMRGLNLQLIKENIRINVICPWMTKTPMAQPLEEGWSQQGLPANEATDVAESMIICATANRAAAMGTHHHVKLPFAGKILWVGGAKSYEIEDNIQALEPRWLGEGNSKAVGRGQEYLATFGFGED